MTVCSRHFIARCLERRIPLAPDRTKALIERMAPCWRVPGAVEYRLAVRLARHATAIVVWNDERKTLVTAYWADHGHPKICAGGGGWR